MHPQSASHVIVHLMEYWKTALNIVYKPLLWKPNTLNFKSYVKEIPMWMQLHLISIRVMACACTINITCHGTVDEIPENCIQECAQTVVMVTKHSQLTF